MSHIVRWWFEPVPHRRVAIFRVLVYLFIPVDIFLLTPWVSHHADVSHDLYEPLAIAQLLHLPVPTSGFIDTTKWALVATSLIALTGRAPRLIGTAVFLLYFEWMIIAMSYGKVDHDRFAFLVALAVLPTVGTIRFSDYAVSAAAGWAMRAVQVSVVLTYFLAAWAKLRFGHGLNWITGATFARAIVRRGTVFSQWLLDFPMLLQISQGLMVGLELASPLILLARSHRARCLVAASLLTFHLVVFAGVTIFFWPHVLCIAAFLSLEKLRIPRLSRSRSQETDRISSPVIIEAQNSSSNPTLPSIPT